MVASLGAVVIGTTDPRAHAAFYRALLGWISVGDESRDWVRLRDPARERPGLSFQFEAADVPPDWPARDGGVQLQAHLDVLVDDLDAETTRAIGLGATVLDDRTTPGVHVLRDPFGHVFCLFVHGA